MDLPHPFRWISPPAQARVFIALVAVTLVVMVSLQALGAPLQTDEAPLGIVSFELAGSLPAAQSMLESWGPIGRVYAGVNLGLDYLFLVAYAGAIGLGCALLARGLSEGAPPLCLAGVILAWGLIVAGLLDAVENYALVRVLLGSQQELWPLVARWCAIPKFLIVAAGLLFLILGSLAALVLRSGGRSRTG
jgi:hypothetical protein